MRTVDQIMGGANSFIDRMSDGLKVVGSGNTAGLIGMIAALNSIQSGHAETVNLLKPAAIIFALGIFLFSGGYLFLMYSYAYLESYLAKLYPNLNPMPDEDVRVEQAEPAKVASVSYMHWSILCGLASTFVFFCGFVTAFTALVRY
ncbi:hypothetical protein LQG66_28450 [Bradyrhizobium ontarionense]|uniref:Uncharacterized protein n=1 Tax=Bradyrhizobium ontarionense TaxID=2898149 RepID=A0ABY3R7I5_9BRAD|nr:hypothetical protein [Bradyrhizobium sp. A19]UFZ03139.1 hypothetical protein LQG66_28450 [Bradyrhizobium sp. A19]